MHQAKPHRLFNKPIAPLLSYLTNFVIEDTPQGKVEIISKKPFLSLLIVGILFISLLGITSNSQAGQATLTWDANTEADLAGYKVYYGTSPSNYNTSVNVGNVTTYSQTLNDGATYYFAVSAYDTSNNESGYSNEVSKSFGVTNQPPVTTISSPSEGAVFYAGAVLNYSGSGADPESGNLTGSSLKWELDQVGDGLGPVHTSTGSVGSYTFPSDISTDITYELKLTVTDNDGLANYKIITITLKPLPSDTTPPAVSGVGINNITTSEATVTWATDETATSQVEYWTNTLDGRFSSLDNSLAKSHTVTLTALTPNTVYHFRVLSVDGAGNKGVSPEYSFSTLKVAQPDTPAAITDLRIQSGSSTRNSLTLEWTATGADGVEGTASMHELRMSTYKIIEDGIIPTEGEINFSKATKVPPLSTPKVAGTSETVQVGQLETNSVYYFAIKAKDDKGNLSAISNVVNGDNVPPLPVTAIRQGYTMISFPLVPVTPDVQTLLSGFTGNTAELYWWSSSGIGDNTGAFILENNVVPGYGYFLKSDIDTAILNIVGTVVTDASSVIPLQPGWNVIGNPYPKEVYLRNTYIKKVDTGELKNYEDAVIAGWVGNALYNYNGSTYDFELYTEARLKLWRGYWLAVLQNGQYEIVIYKP